MRYIDKGLQLDVSTRTDQKESEIMKRMANDNKMVACAKAVGEDVNPQDYALNRETGKVFVIPINSKHTVTFLDHENAPGKTEREDNKI